MNKGDTFLLIHKVAGRPDIATIVHDPGFIVVMEGEYKGKKVRFHEHISKFKTRWRQQLSLFDSKIESKLSKKYLK